METPMDEMSTDFKAPIKAASSNVVDNFNTADHLYITAWTGLCAIYGHSCWKRRRVISGAPNVVTGGLVGLSLAFGGAYWTTAARMGLFPYKK